MKVVDTEQGSFHWRHLRQGILTGTTIGRALGSPAVQKTLLYEITAQRMTEPSPGELNTRAVERGKSLEPIALKAAAINIGLEFETCGMLFPYAKMRLPGVAFSPDGIVRDGNKVVGGIEIKCPDSKTHLKYIVEGGVPKDYHYQVKAPFILSNDVEFWYFVSFDDRNYERPIFIHKVVREDFDDIVEERKKLRGFVYRVNKLHEELTF